MIENEPKKNGDDETEKILVNVAIMREKFFLYLYNSLEFSFLQHLIYPLKEEYFEYLKKTNE